ncbi:MAG: hypothetical protein ACTMIY_10255, partial [Microbacterium gubbeenense]
MSDESRQPDDTSVSGPGETHGESTGAAPQPPVRPAPPLPPQTAPADPHGPNAQQQALASAVATAREKLPAPLAAKAPWVAAMVSAGLALAGAFVMSAVITLFALFGGRLLIGAYGGSAFLEAVGPHWFAIIAQLLGAGFGGALNTSADIFGAASVSASVLFIPVLVPIAALVSVRLFARRAAPPTDLAAAWRLVVSAAAGIAFALVVVIVQVVAPIAVPISDTPVELTLRAISAWSIILGIVLVGAATYVALTPIRASRSRARSALVQAVEHVGSLGVIIAIAVVVVAAWNGDGAGQVIGMLLLVPLLLPFLAADGGAIATLATVGVTVRGGSALDMLDEYGGLGGVSGLAENLPTLWMFSETLPLWVRIVLPIAAIIAPVIVSVRWRVRSGIANDAASWALLPVAYGVLGILVTVIGRFSVSASYSTSGDFGALLDGNLGGSASIAFGPAAWTFLLFAAAGAIVEVLARFAVPAFVGSAPGGLVRTLAFGATAGSAAAAAAGAPVPAHPSAPAPPATPAAPAVPASPGARELEDPAALPMAPAQPLVPADSAVLAAYGAPAVPPAPAYGAGPVDPLAAMLAGGAREHKPLSKGAKVGGIVGGSAVVLIAILLVAGVVVKNQLAATTYSAEARAEQYLSAIVDGDADRALSLWAPNVTSAERVLLSPEIYEAAENRPTSFAITGADEYEGIVDVTAQLMVDSKNYDVHLRLQKDGTQAVLFDDWRIVEGPSQSLVVGDVSQVSSVNGVDVDLSGFADAVNGGVALPVLPGAYMFEAPTGDGGPFTYGDDVAVTVLPNDGGPEQQGAQQE